MYLILAFLEFLPGPLADYILGGHDVRGRRLCLFSQGLLARRKHAVVPSALPLGHFIRHGPGTVFCDFKKLEFYQLCEYS